MLSLFVISYVRRSLRWCGVRRVFSFWLDRFAGWYFRFCVLLFVVARWLAIFSASRFGLLWFDLLLRFRVFRFWRVARLLVLQLALQVVHFVCSSCLRSLFESFPHAGVSCVCLFSRCFFSVRGVVLAFFSSPFCSYFCCWCSSRVCVVRAVCSIALVSCFHLCFARRCLRRAHASPFRSRGLRLRRVFVAVRVGVFCWALRVVCSLISVVLCGDALLCTSIRSFRSCFAMSSFFDSVSFARWRARACCVVLRCWLSLGLSFRRVSHRCARARCALRFFFFSACSRLAFFRRWVRLCFVLFFFLRPLACSVLFCAFLFRVGWPCSLRVSPFASVPLFVFCSIFYFAFVLRVVFVFSFCVLRFALLAFVLGSVFSLSVLRRCAPLRRSLVSFRSRRRVCFPSGPFRFFLSLRAV